MDCPPTSVKRRFRLYHSVFLQKYERNLWKSFCQFFEIQFEVKVSNVWLGQKEKGPQCFCENFMLSPLFLSRKFSKSTILKTPKIHSEFLRCAIQLFLTDNSDTLLRCVKISNTCERVLEQVCRTKIVILLLLF